MQTTTNQQTVETTTATTKEEMNMTMTTTSIVQAILASPELEATLVKLINQLQTPATKVEEAPAKETTPQERNQADPATVTRRSNPQGRNMTMGILRGTDDFKSLPLEGVMSPRKANIQAMVLEMGRQVAAMYDGGMRTLFTVLFPGAEMLIVNVIELLHENGRCLDLKIVGLDSKTFQNIRENRVHTARVYDDSRLETFKSKYEVIWFDGNSEMSYFLRNQLVGHFLMVSDKDINENLKKFFVQQRSLGAKGYYVSPAKYSTIWTYEGSEDNKDPEGPKDPQGPNGGGAPAPAQQQAPAPAMSTSTIPVMDPSAFEGLLPSSTTIKTTEVAPAPSEETLSQDEIAKRTLQEYLSTMELIAGSHEVAGMEDEDEDEQEEEEASARHTENAQEKATFQKNMNHLMETLDPDYSTSEKEAQQVNEPEQAETPAPAADDIKITIPDGLFGDAPLSQLMTSNIVPGQPLNLDLPTPEKKEKPVAQKKSTPVAKKEKKALSIPEHVFRHLTRQSEVVNRSQATSDLIAHYNVGHLLDPKMSNSTMHDFALASLATVAAQTGGDLDLEDAFLFLIKLARYQSTEFVSGQYGDWSNFTMEDPYAYFLEASGVDEESQLYTLVCSAIESLMGTQISAMYEVHPSDFAEGPLLSTPAPSFL